MAPDVLRICSVTLCQHSDGREVEGLHTVLPWVDGVVILDTHAEPWHFPEAREFCGDKLQIVHRGPITDRTPSNEYRAESLEIAAQLGFDWAAILDSDERFEVAPELDVRAALRATEANAISCDAIGDSYAKEKLFRLSALGAWHLPAHEVYDCGGNVATIPGLAFREEPKTPEQFAVRRQVVRILLGEYVTREPAPPALSRAWQMLAHEAIGAQEFGEAQRCLGRAIATGPSVQNQGWLRYLLGCCLVEGGSPAQALQAVYSGLPHTPWMPELHYLAAQAWLSLGEPYNAIAACNCAVALGDFRGSGRSIERLGYYDAAARWDGPFELMAEAFLDASQPEEAARMIALADAAKRSRLGT